MGNKFHATKLILFVHKGPLFHAPLSHQQYALSEKKTQNITQMPTVEVPTFRLIYLNDAQKNESSKFLHNRISTAKYNVFTFLGKFLFEQFSKYANIFFLFTVIIQVFACADIFSNFQTFHPRAGLPR